MDVINVVAEMISILLYLAVHFIAVYIGIIILLCLHSLVCGMLQCFCQCSFVCARVIVLSWTSLAFTVLFIIDSNGFAVRCVFLMFASNLLCESIRVCYSILNWEFAYFITQYN